MSVCHLAGKDSKTASARMGLAERGCRGECPTNRFLRTPYGEPGLNYLCAAYQRFFRHVAPAMRGMAWLARQQRPPAETMTMGVPGRNGSATTGATPVQE